MRLKNFYILLLVLIGFVACKQREEVEFTIPFTLSLPATEEFNSHRAPALNHAIGDPGKTELFKMPHHVYIFIMLQDGSNWPIMEVIEKTLTDTDWEKTRYHGAFQTEGDSIYKYTSQLHLPLAENGVNGRVCAIASAEPLTFNVANLNSLVGQDWNDLMDLTIDISSNTMQENLQYIYSSPYNYMRPDFNEYYGSFNNNSNVAYLDLVLYHIAAKVDLNWSVAADKRINNADPSQAVRLTYLEVRNLLNSTCYAFRPMENTVASLPSTGYNIPIITTDNDEGQWWEGRTYFYTIPFTVTGKAGYFPIQLLMKTNGNTGSGYQLRLNQPITTSDPFVPWIRGNITLTQPLTDGTSAEKDGSSN